MEFLTLLDPTLISGGILTVGGLVAAIRTKNIFGILYYGGQVLELAGGLMKRIGGPKLPESK